MSKTSPNPHKIPSRNSSPSRKGTPRTAYKQSTKAASKPAASSTYRVTLVSSHRRLHIAPPSSASEIRDALGVSESELKAALDAIESSE